MWYGRFSPAYAKENSTYSERGLVVSALAFRRSAQAQSCTHIKKSADYNAATAGLFE